MFDELDADPARLEQFTGAMTSVSLGNFHALEQMVCANRVLIVMRTNQTFR